MTEYEASLNISGAYPRGRIRRWILGIGLLLTATAMAIAVILVVHWIRQASTVACGAHLYRLGYGMLLYQEEHGHLPPAYTVGPNRRRMHSWRILVILSDYFVRGYDFDEPWDSAKNKQFGDDRPSGFACPSAPATRGGERLTNYFVVTGNTTPFPGSGTTSLPIFAGPRGRSKTILIVESSNLNVEWLEPRDLAFDEMSFVPNDPKRPSISSYHPDGPLVLMADGSTRSIKGIAPEVLRAMLQHMPDGDK